MGLLLEPPRRPAPRLAVFADSAAHSAGPRVWPLPGLRLPSGRFQPAVFSTLADFGDLRRLHPHSLAHLLPPGALRYRSEERRVGEAGRSRWAPSSFKKK